MEVFLAIILISHAATFAAASAVEHSAMMALSGGVFGRQIDICVPVPPPVTCERSCGPGFIQCVAPHHCYNPGRGDVCCSNRSSSCSLAALLFIFFPPQNP